MLRVGLTGGIGSGKSTVAGMLRDLGAQVSSSDEIGRALMQPGTEMFSLIVSRFGQEVVRDDGQLDRVMLARIAFDDGRAEELNGIVHPAVIRAQQQWMKQVARERPKAVTVVESALLFETVWHGDGSAAPWRTRFDRIVVVTAPLEVRRERYIGRMGGSVIEDEAAADFARRSAVQWDDESKAALADFVLKNGGSLENLHSGVERVYASLRQESVDQAAEAM